MARARGKFGATGFELRGDKELHRALSKLDRATEGHALTEALMAGSKPIIRHAKSTVPKRKGKLMRSLDSEVGKVGKRYAWVRVGPGPETEVTTKKGRVVSYGLFSEYGVRGQKRLDWLKHATQRGKSQFESIVRLRLRRILLKHTR